MKLTDLSKTYGERTLFSHLSFSLERGIIQLCGPSGCGKSTLIRLCLGFEKPTEGEISYGDFSFAAKNPKEIASFRNEKLGYCGDGSSLLYSFSLKENLARLLPQANEERKKTLCAKLSFNKRDQPLFRLSGGERHKAELIFALLSDKETLFLDEPFSALDLQSKSVLVELINDYSQNHLVVLVNHDSGVAGLAPSLKADIPSGKVETLAPALALNDNPKKIPLPKKRSVASFFFRDFLKSFRFEFMVETLLLVASFLSLFYGLSSYPSRDRFSAEKLAMENDPFSSFVLGGSEIDQHAEFNAFVKEKADTSCFFSSWSDYSIVLVSVKGLPSDSTFYVDDDYGKAPESVALSGQALIIDGTYKLPADKGNYFLRSYQEKNGRSFIANGVYFVSPAFIDSFLDAGGFPALALDGQSGTLPPFLYCANDEIGLQPWLNNKPLPIQIQGGSADVLLLPSVQKGQTVRFHKGEDGWVGPSLTASGSSPDGTTLVVSPDYYRYLCYLEETYYSPFNMGLLPAFQKKSVLDFETRFPGSEVSGIIRPDYAYSESLGNLFLGIGIGLFAFYLLVIGFSFKGKRRYFRNAAFFLSLQGFSPFENGGLLTMPFFLQGLLGEGIGLLFYGTCFIPQANALLYQHNYESSYAKSRGLELYALTEAPLPFEIFNLWAYLSLALLLVIYGTMILVLVARNNQSKVMRRIPLKTTPSSQTPVR